MLSFYIYDEILLVHVYVPCLSDKSLYDVVWSSGNELIYYLCICCFSHNNPCIISSRSDKEIVTILTPQKIKTDSEMKRNCACVFVFICLCLCFWLWTHQIKAYWDFSLKFVSVETIFMVHLCVFKRVIHTFCSRFSVYHSTVL